MYNSKLANYINSFLAVIKLILLTIIAIGGLIKLPSMLREGQNNWSKPIQEDIGRGGFGEFSFSFVLVCN